GRLCGQSKKTTAGWHGLTSWAVSILVVAVVMTTAAGTIVAGPLSDMMGTGAGQQAAAAGGATAPADPMAGATATQVDEVSGSVAGGAFFAAIALLLGALAAWWGSRLGAVEPEVLRSDSRMDMPLH